MPLVKRRSLLTISIAGTMLVLSLVLLVAMRSGLPTRERGQLDLALSSAQNNSGLPEDRIATDSGHQAVVSDTSVLWYDQAGHEFVTTTSGSTSVLDVFHEYHFFNYRSDTAPATTALITALVGPIAMVVMVIFLMRFLRKGAPGMSLRNSRARDITGEMTGITFADVAGCDEARTELAEIVNILKNPERYAAIGARTPKGVILVGPPGTGKTLLARAVAGEASVPFITASGSEFVELFVGVGASRVRDLFEQARAKAPAIIFIDEIDALGKRRSQSAGQGNEEREQTLNQLLVEMDGIDTAAPVIIIAATNRADVLDPALIRPGRFDRQVTVDLPDIIGRRAILDVHGRNKPFAKDIDFGVVARQTPGFSGADLANLVNEAALLAARDDSATISMANIENAAMRVMAGPERTNNLLSEHERRVVAYHEMGHAVVGHVLPHADPVHKVSIVSRGRALGWTMPLPERDRVLSSRNQLTDRLAGLLGGRMAEELIFGADEVTSGAADDIEKATRIAYQMVTQLGMSPLGIRAFLPGEFGEPRTYSEEMASAIDLEVERLLEEASLRARTVLRDRRRALDALADRLLDIETMDAEELTTIVAGFPSRAVPRATIISLPSRTKRVRVHRPRDDDQSDGTELLTPELAPLVPRRRGVAVLNMRRTSMAFLRLFRDVPTD